LNGADGGAFSVSELRAPRSALARYAPPAELRRSIANENTPPSAPFNAVQPLLNFRNLAKRV